MWTLFVPNFSHIHSLAKVDITNLTSELSKDYSSSLLDVDIAYALIGRFHPFLKTALLFKCV